MKRSGKTQWEVYAELEEIPHTVASPQVRQSVSASVLANAWRSLLDIFLQELLYEQQVEYLERCMALSQFQPNQAAPKTLNQLQKLFSAVITA